MNFTKINISLLFSLFVCAFLNAQCTDNGNVWHKSWQSCATSQSPNTIRGNSHWILYEFDQAENIDSTHIWNANKIGLSNLGAKDVIFDYSVDGTTWIELGNFTFNKADESANYEGFNGPNFGGIFLEKILITFLNNHDSLNNTCVSLAEVQFNINKDACYGVLDVCGVCDGNGETEWFEDLDNDGLGNELVSVTSCLQPAGFVANNIDVCDNGLLGWNDISSIFTENGCTGCHGNNSYTGLDLLSYAGISSGGYICGASILTGTKLVDIIQVSGYAGCNSPISIPSMNSRTGDQMDPNELSILQQWIDDGALEDCNCLPNAIDTDNDGVCDYSDLCPNFDDGLIGTACDDGNDCTDNDLYIDNCSCAGTPSLDSDADGICDYLDFSPNNACTADGIEDGNEPIGWISANNADCDFDGITAANGDLDDFDKCLNNNGYTYFSTCFCADDVKVGSAKVVAYQNVSDVEYADGIPNGTYTSNVYSSSEIIFKIPYMSYGDEICFALGFNNPLGVAGFDINGYFFSFPNPTGDTTFARQDVCFPVFAEGEQTIKLIDIGANVVRVDGSYYNYCACSISDQNYNRLACTCKNNIDSTTTNTSYSSGITNSANANGFPDGIITNQINSNDSLMYQFANETIGTELCVTLQFNDAMGTLGFELNGDYHLFANKFIDSVNIFQQICLPVLTDGIQNVLLQDKGVSYLKVDGISARKCASCATNEDDDNDNVCNDFDACNGYDDFADVDFDGIPNDCENCDVVNNLSAIDIDTNTATIIFSSTDQANSNKIFYKTLSSNYWNEISIYEDTLVLNALLGCTDYEVKVVSNCSFGNLSAESNTITFKTEGCPLICNEVLNLSSSNNAEQSTIVQWDYVPNATYSLFKKELSASNWIETELNFPFAVLINLNFCSDYEWYIEVTCENGITSQSSAIQQFTTSCITSNTHGGALLNYDKNEALKLYPNPVINQLTIESANTLNMSKINILNALGQIVYSNENLNLSTTFQINTSQFEIGNYWVDLRFTDGSYKVLSFIKTN